MRALILAAGLGTRMGPLSRLCAKPALPVLGRPVIAWQLEWLAHHGVEEVAINLHHRPGSIESAVERFAPPGLSVIYSREPQCLGTGGGIAALREFLVESDPALVIAGDAILDGDIPDLVARHRNAGNACTLLMARPSEDHAGFGTLGVDADGAVRRIADRFDLGQEVARGVFVGVRLLSPALFDSLPTRAPGTPFEDLSDWWAPMLAAGHRGIRGQFADPGSLVFRPVGTPAEYLEANFTPPRVSFLDDSERAAPGTREGVGGAQVILGANAEVGAGARLERCVVWEGERIPANFEASGGVFAGGKFYACQDSPEHATTPATREGRGPSDG